MDELATSPEEMFRHFQGVSVVLCTLSNLSNPGLPKIISFVPLENLVIDEASQISVYDFMVSAIRLPILMCIDAVNLQHLFSRFKRLRKACFFGDPKQRESG